MPVTKAVAIRSEVVNVAGAGDCEVFERVAMPAALVAWICADQGADALLDFAAGVERNPLTAGAVRDEPVCAVSLPIEEGTTGKSSDA